MSTSAKNNSHSVSPPRGIDHAVIAADDLEQLAETYRGLGFQVGARNAHPWGTANHIVQFGGSFLELIGVAQASSIPPHKERHHSFGAFIRDFLEQGQGMAMLALETRNAIADALEFRRERLGDFEPFHFERQGLGPDGQPRKVSFSLAFTQTPAHPRAGFFLCQQHQPQNFWDVAKQKHPNGVTGIASVILVADDPSDEHEFLGAFINQREMRSTSFGLELDTGRGLVEVLSPQAFAFRFGVDAPIVAGQGTQFAAIEFAGTGVHAPAVAVRHGGLAVVPADAAGNIVLAFKAD